MIVILRRDVRGPTPGEFARVFSTLDQTAIVTVDLKDKDDVHFYWVVDVSKENAVVVSLSGIAEAIIPNEHWDELTDRYTSIRSRLRDYEVERTSTANVYDVWRVNMSRGIPT